jgi:flavin reductase (DIM6/NTAB) family NADH-FMN oxidoreductase RutF
MSGNGGRRPIDFAELSATERYHFMISTIVPRPIAWVSTRGPSGDANLAPFSFYQGVCADPPTIMISFATKKRSGERKDTLANIEATGSFVINVVDESLLDSMVVSSIEYPSGTSEIEITGLGTFPASRVDAPCLTASPVNMECRLAERVSLGGCVAIFGEILLVHARESVLDARGNVDPERLRPVARLGGSLYTLYSGAVSRKTPGRS